MSACGCSPAAAGCGCAAAGGCGAAESARGPEVSNLEVQGRPAAAPELLRAERAAWCGTGAAPDGMMFPGSMAIPDQNPPGTSLRLTPFGAYAAAAGVPTGLAVFEVADRYRLALAQGPTGRLFPQGPNLLLPDPATALFTGGPVRVGAKSGGGRTVPRRQWEQVPSTLRAAARAQGFGPEASFRPPGGVAVPEGVEFLSGTRASVGELGPADVSRPSDEGPCACEGTYECALANKVVLDYLGFRLCVPESWFWNQYEADSWVSRSETLDVLWAAVESTGTGVRGEDLDGLLGCWMIDTAKDTHGRSYGMFFEDKDAPRKFLRYALDLVRRFSSEIKDDWSGTTACSGLREYIEAVLSGAEGTTLTEAVGPCTIRFRAVSESSTLPEITTSRACGGASETVHCGSEAGMGGDFQDWQQVMGSSYTDHSPGGTIYKLKVNSGFPAPWEQPEASFLGFCIPTSGAVQLPANQLAFRGYQLDFTLFWARVALDYAYNYRRWDSLHGAWVYARGALAELVDYSRMLIHELGHAHMGAGGHCAAVGKGEVVPACCFDIAAEHWRCRVASTLGLPDLGTLSCQPDPLVHNLNNLCGGDSSAYPLVCDRGALCVPLTTAGFLAGPCA